MELAAVVNDCVCEPARASLTRADPRGRRLDPTRHSHYRARGDRDRLGMMSGHRSAVGHGGAALLEVHLAANDLGADGRVAGAASRAFGTPSLSASPFARRVVPFPGDWSLPPHPVSTNKTAMTTAASKAPTARYKRASPLRNTNRPAYLHFRGVTLASMQHLRVFVAVGRLWRGRPGVRGVRPAG
jgi:hypothetical protein